MATSNTKQSPLHTLLPCALVAVLFTLAINALRGGYPSARMAYAVFVSVLPAVVTWPTAAKLKLSRKWTVVVYVILFLLTVLLQAGLR